MCIMEWRSDAIMKKGKPVGVVKYKPTHDEATGEASVSHEHTNKKKTRLKK